MYSQTQYEVLLTATNVTATTSGIKAQWGPGMHPHIVRGVAILLMSGEPVNPGQVIFDHLDLASGATASTIATINTTSDDLSGDVIYKDGLNVEIQPGQVMRVRVPAIVSGELAFFATAYVEPRWERPANVSDMRETT